MGVGIGWEYRGTAGPSGRAGHPPRGPRAPRALRRHLHAADELGEYVHFTSGAAAADMSGQAARAFGWPREWADQLEHARAQFPSITY
jgi:hypothetical protein